MKTQSPFSSSSHSKSPDGVFLYEIGDLWLLQAPHKSQLMALNGAFMCLFLSREPCCFTLFCVQKKAEKALTEQDEDRVMDQLQDFEKVRNMTLVLFV